MRSNLLVDDFACNMQNVMRYINHGALPNSIILGSSNPILPRPEIVRNAIVEAADNSMDIYSEEHEPHQKEGNTLRYYSSRTARGIEPLRSNLTEYCKNKGFNTANLDFFISHSIADGLLNSFLDSHILQGDNLLLTTPTFGPFFSMFYSRKINTYIEKLSEETDWKITPAMLDELLKLVPDAKAFLLINPGNPMGEVYTKEELEGLASVFIVHNQTRLSRGKAPLIVVSDEVAKNIIITPGKSFTSISSIPGMEDFTYTLWSLSKDNGPGIGVAIGIGPKWLIEKLRGDHDGPSFFVQSAAASIYKEANQKDIEEHYTKQNNIYKDNLVLANGLVTELNQRLAKRFHKDPEFNPIITLGSSPDGGFQVTLKATGLLDTRFPEGYVHNINPQQAQIENSLDLVWYLRQTAKVELMPGEGFGFDGTEMMLRMTLSKRPEKLIEAMSNIGEELSKLSPRPKWLDEILANSPNSISNIGQLEELFPDMSQNLLRKKDFVDNVSVTSNITNNRQNISI